MPWAAHSASSHALASPALDNARGFPRRAPPTCRLVWANALLGGSGVGGLRALSAANPDPRLRPGLGVLLATPTSKGDVGASTCDCNSISLV
jgi:hypothetical protein